MLPSKIFKEAHKMTKEIKKEFPEVDYKFQFGLNLAYLLKEGEHKLEGSEKQVKWANDIKNTFTEIIDDIISKVEKVPAPSEKSLKNKNIALEDLKVLKENFLSFDYATFFIDHGKELKLDSTLVTKCHYIKQILSLFSNANMIAWGKKNLIIEEHSITDRTLSYLYKFYPEED